MPASAVSSQTAARPVVVLSEVLFGPRAGDTAFVELLNAGRSPAYLDSMLLKIDTLVIALPPLADAIPPAARVLIRFDGRGTVEGRVVHTAADVSLNVEGGTLTLLDNDDRVYDQLAYGTAPGAFVPTTGGLAMDDVELGSSLGRPPGANRPGALHQWVVYAPDLTTPGEPNPLPPVAQLIPVSGAILEATSIELLWYPVAGAARYRVQVASDTTFGQPVLDRTVDERKVNTGQLPAGLYWWRVQAIPAEGPPAPWSPVQRIELGVSTGGHDDGERGSGPSDGSNSGGTVLESPTAPKLLPVPLIMQHKDSKMLHLESLQEGRLRTAALNPRMPHAWDRDHGDLDVEDPADNMNCTLASLAMVNRYYGKDLTQDRIGYEGWSRNIAKYRATIQATANLNLIVKLVGSVNPADLVEGQIGPERDLHFGQGMPWGRLLAEGLFALGSLPSHRSMRASGIAANFAAQAMWDNIRIEIDARRPVLAGVPGHAIVIRGYGVTDGRRLVYINDPWFGQYAMDIDAPSGPSMTTLTRIWIYDAPTARAQEPEVSLDSDGDGVVDFDETERFRTNPNSKDTDKDGVPDKEDIESGTYEAKNGYGYAYNPGPDIQGRDHDKDGIPNELDPDSDDGGCKDGEEDTNGNGEWSANETDNFDATDDFCGNLQGNLSYRKEVRGTAGPATIVKYGLNEGVIKVRVKPEPGNPGLFEDDSTTFRYRAVSIVEVGDRDCIVRARSVGSGGGRIVPPDGHISIGVADDGTVSVSMEMSMPGVTRVSGCNYGGSGTLMGGLSFPDCQGKEVPAPRRPGTPVLYRFKCSQSGTTLDGSTWSTDASGYLQLVPPPP